MGSRSARAAGITLAVIGVACLAVAAVLAWLVVPRFARVPDDKASTRRYDGTAKLAVNAEALGSGDTARALIINTPVNAVRTVKVEATDGDAAEVNDARTLRTDTGTVIGRTSTTFAVNRRSLENEPEYPTSWKVTPHEGLTVSFPIGTGKQDYKGWINETQRTTTLRYSGTATRSGITTYVFKAKSSPEQITDPATLATLPQALPVSALSALGPVLPIPADDKQRLAQALPGLTQPVPLSYTFQVDSTYWVDPTTGIVVDNKRQEIRKAGLRLPTGQPFATALPVYDVTTAFTPSSRDEAADDAERDGRNISLWGGTVPLILLIVGAVLLVAGIVLLVLGFRRRPRPGDGTPAPAPPVA